MSLGDSPRPERGGIIRSVFYLLTTDAPHCVKLGRYVVDALGTGIFSPRQRLARVNIIVNIGGLNDLYVVWRQRAVWVKNIWVPYGA